MLRLLLLLPMGCLPGFELKAQQEIVGEQYPSLEANRIRMQANATDHKSLQQSGREGPGAATHLELNLKAVTARKLLSLAALQARRAAH